MKVLAAAVVCAALGFAGLVVRAEMAVMPVGPGVPVPYAPAFRGVTSGPGALMNFHDGQAFGSLALDPLLAHPERWSTGGASMAYRATRPLMGWLVALTSFGSAGVAAWSLLVWTAVGIGLTAGAAAFLSVRWGRRPDWVPLVLFLPGVAGLVRYGGLSDGIAAGLALFGFGLWLADDGRRGGQAAVVLFCLAALCRESALVVPAALWLGGGRGAGRGGEGRRWRWRWRLVWPFAVYVAWVVAVGLRLGVVPTDPSEGKLALPFTGLVHALPGWTWVGWVCALSTGVLMLVAWRRAPAAEVRWLVGVSLLFASVLGEHVWRSWDFARALLPVTIVGAVLVQKTVRGTDNCTNVGGVAVQPGVGAA